MISKDTMSVGEYTLKKYNEYKSTIKEQGQEDQGRFYTDEVSLGNDKWITYGAVDDNPKTHDEISTYGESQSSGVKSTIEETFQEYMREGRLVIEFDYLQRMAVAGTTGTARMGGIFDAKTGEKIMDKSDGK